MVLHEDDEEQKVLDASEDEDQVVARRRKGVTTAGAGGATAGGAADGACPRPSGPLLGGPSPPRLCCARARAALARCCASRSARPTWDEVKPRTAASCRA